MTQKKRKNLLDFWTLCEIADFERFKLNEAKITSFSLNNHINTKPIYCEYEKIKYKKDKYYDMVNIEHKKNSIYKIFIGIIKSKDAINFIYTKLKERDLLPPDSMKKAEEDLENLPHMPDYTYMAYMYVDSNQNMISISDKSLVINPLFYILKNLLEKSLVNTQAYKDFTENVSSEFSEKNCINKNSQAYIIPDLNFMMKKAKILNKSNFLAKIKNSKICILDELKKDIESLAKDNNEDAKKLLLFFKKEDENENSNFIFPDRFKTNSISHNHYLDTSIGVAKKKYYDYIYLLTNDKLDLPHIDIPINLYLTTFIDNNKLIFPSLKYNKHPHESKITNEKLSQVFNDCCKKLYLTDTNNNPIDIFYIEPYQKLSIFQKKYFNQKFQEINDIEKDEFLSYYINALDEEPAKTAISYIDGSIEKIDINADINTRKKYNSYKFFTQITSKWVTEHSLYYAQQMAVNQFLNKLNTEDNNIFSVNGPPGTGKTTLLKDVIANIITRRIEHCIKLDGQLFDTEGNLKGELCGKYETIVSSNNNAAVENITRELPNIEEFDFNYIDYKKDDFLLSKFADIFYDKESWNFISINLGKGENIKNFKDKFETFKEEVKKSPLLDKKILKTRKGILIDKIYASKKKLTKFNETLIDLSNITKIEQNKEKHKQSIITLNNELETHHFDISSTKDNITKLNKKLFSSKKSINIDEKIISLKEDEKLEYNIFTKIFQYNNYKKLKYELSTQKKSLSSNLLNFKKLEENLLKESTILQSLNHKFDSVKEKYKVANNEYSRLVDLYSFLYEQKMKYNINDDSFYEKDEDNLQISSLFANKEQLKEKSLHFALSMQLSEVFFLLNFDNFCTNIDDFFTNHKKPLLDKEKLQKNFSSLFFILPVISTSLASSYAMLKNINSYGTLLCDESGQATPQSLIGLLNRANNALIVGDPLQVEPVFTAPIILINLIQDMYKIDDKYSPVKSSAQKVADNANTLGSYYEVGGKELWVGMPLVVHRRCVEPMFSISNKISYNEKMVLATPTIDKDDDINNLPPSGWIDVKSQENDFKGTHTSSLEIEKLRGFIDKYKNYLQNNYYIISPFKDIYKYQNEFNPEAQKDKSKVILGTVHTFQGKEQDVIFFILGGNLKREGAKNWVSSKPNILNVANTRGKKRIYFIGDYELWKKHNYFKIAISELSILKI